MGSLLKTYDEYKLKGKVYTPSWIVNKMLDEINYCGENILDKRVLDPACGDGRFLIEVVKRIIQFVPEPLLPNALENVYGWDIDEDAVKQCISHLDELIKPFKIKMNWNIEVKNSILSFPPNIILESNYPLFDFIIGNPPYIRIQHLDKFQRVFIQHHYNFCKEGSTDIYIAFFELCFHLLNKNGVGAFITPNTYLYTQTAKIFRQYIQTNKNISKIINFRSLPLFQNKGTYSAITIFTKEKQDKLIYEAYENPIKSQKSTHSYNNPLNNVFESIKRSNTSISVEKKGKKLKDVCKIGVGITTLCDKAYIFGGLEKIDEKYCYVQTKLKGRIKIETALLKPIIKGSTYKGDEGHPKEFILFPYHKINNKYQIIPEDILKLQYPFSYEYLLSVKNILDKRDNGKPNPVSWYAFGRHQSLDTAFGKKIIFSPMNKYPNFVLSNLEECTLYSGYFIKYDGDYQKLLSELNSERMYHYINAASRDFRGGWKAYNKKVLEDFEVFL